jgi:hypothetical protein
MKRNVVAVLGMLLVAHVAGAQFTQQGGKLLDATAIGAVGQGQAVAISADGNTAIVGGNNDSAGAGAAWVYTRSGGVWAQQGNGDGCSTAHSHLTVDENRYFRVNKFA